ncbi:MAG: potassium channel family protein [Vicingaceae bacterium]|nr:potassium channel family protein [Vicingaceae bacterium]
MLIWKAVLSFLKDRDYLELLITTIIVILIGASVFHYLEGWRWLDSIYFCVITLTTIGYGDITPNSDAGKIFNMIYVLIGLGLILSFIKTVYDHYDKTKKELKKKKY